MSKPMDIGASCHWNHDPSTKLVYLGHNLSGNGYWHQFALANDEDKKVWCEVTDKELPMITVEKSDGTSN